ncbi:uncharacterized protein LOC126774760 isoform X2 [Nymphalis io]|nr:uncharacterized protein LOC126774760 isoform X2 [Nymphalis io]XP_050352254.1 uncharacterized protein LOC126774760 isoform X2 [Nymphalis io]
MELVSFVKEVLQNAAESAASYRLGQTVLRYMDRALWIVEKSARWAVPPPLDQEERPQPELIRPLPWVFFLALLIVLRVTRESISLVNLAFGKPPLRSADVVIYIQSKRRYLRTLKYQGNRMMRARTEPTTRESWFSSFQSLFEFTMCFRRQHYGNNNTQLSNGDEVLVVKRNKRGREADADSSMERLIEKMMVDIDADSDDSSGYTLTNITNPRSDKSDYNTESDQDTIQTNKNADGNGNRSNSSAEGNTYDETWAATDNTDDTELPNSDHIYKLDSKKYSIDFIKAEISNQVEQIIKNQHKISNGRAANDSSINESPTDAEAGY